MNGHESYESSYEIIDEEISSGVRFSLREAGREVGHAYLYILRNDLHDKPFGLMEDVFVDESQRGRGGGSSLVLHLVEAAQRRSCYKLIGTSRFERENVHRMYDRLGFRRHGIEFRKEFV